MSRQPNNPALDAVRAEQRPDGGFSNLSTPDLSDFSTGRTFSTTFIPSLILCALNRVAGSEGIRQELASYLLSQRKPSGSFNYWDASAPEAASLAYPDDLDDTFLALAALKGHDGNAVGGAWVAGSLGLLTACEERPGGPYRTWLVNRDAPEVWRDVDLAVNSNVAFFLSQFGASVPGIEALQAAGVEAGTFSSPYYHGWQPVAYFVARSCQEELKEELAERISQLVGDTGWGNPAQTAMAVSSLALLERRELAREGLGLLPTEKFEPEAVIRDPYLEGVLHYAGSAALTAALCLEARSLCAQRSRPQAKLPASAARAQELLDAEAKALAPALRPGFETALGRSVRSANGLRVLSLPALLDPSAPEPLLVNLALIAAYGWLAYTLYDDFLDGEGVPAMLPVANLASRRLTATIATTLPETEFPSYALAALDRMEAANAWEAENCRFHPGAAPEDLPDFKDASQLAERSWGHALPALALCIQKGHAPESPVFKAVEAYFKSYLIARQLNDDAHDWKEDLAAGQLTYATSLLLGEAEGDLDRFYWHVTIRKLSETIIEECRKARLEIPAFAEAFAPEPFEAMISHYEKAAKNALAAHRRTTEFLEAYSER